MARRWLHTLPLKFRSMFRRSESQASRSMEKMLFGIAPTDKTTFAGAAVLLGAVAVLASLEL